MFTCSTHLLVFHFRFSSVLDEIRNFRFPPMNNVFYLCSNATTGADEAEAKIRQLYQITALLVTCLQFPRRTFCSPAQARCVFYAPPDQSPTVYFARAVYVERVGYESTPGWQPNPQTHLYGIQLFCASLYPEGLMILVVNP